MKFRANTSPRAFREAIKTFFISFFATMLISWLKIFDKDRVIINLKNISTDPDIECLDNKSELPDVCYNYSATVEATGVLSMRLSVTKAEIYGCISPCMDISQKVQILADTFTCTFLPKYYSIESTEYRIPNSKEIEMRIEYKIDDQNSKSKPKLN